MPFSGLSAITAWQLQSCHRPVSVFSVPMWSDSPAWVKSAASVVGNLLISPPIAFSPSSSKISPFFGKIRPSSQFLLPLPLTAISFYCRLRVLFVKGGCGVFLHKYLIFSNLPSACLSVLLVETALFALAGNRILF